MTEHAPYKILFVCSGNSCRSIMAEAIMNRIGAGKFVAASGGTSARGDVHPHTLTLLSSLEYDTTTLTSKGLDQVIGAGNEAYDFIVTLCDAAHGEMPPSWPGEPVHAHWSVPDPAAAAGSEVELALAFAEAYRMLSSRIGVFASLPFDKLDRQSLKRHMDEIGRTAERALASG